MLRYVEAINSKLIGKVVEILKLLCLRNYRALHLVAHLDLVDIELMYSIVCLTLFGMSAGWATVQDNGDTEISCQLNPVAGPNETPCKGLYILKMAQILPFWAI